MSLIDYLKDRIQGKAPKGAMRSPRWREVRAEHLKKEPTCRICGGDKRLQVHHRIPFHIAPDKELDPDNLVTLCERGPFKTNCHAIFGHLGNWRRVNWNIAEDLVVWSKRFKGE